MYTLRWYQKAAVDATLGALEHFPGNPVIVLPTGSGKSLCIAELCRHSWHEWGVQSIVLAHRKELLTQNAEKIEAVLEGSVDVGIYSAGLASRDTDHPIVCAGIQSVYKRAKEFGQRKLIIVDEAHLITVRDDGMYRQFLQELGEDNDGMKVVGLTATPYRTSDGSICRHDGIFQRISYNAPVRQLIDEGYLCEITNYKTTTQFDTSNLHTRAGEFVQREMEDLFTGNRDKSEQACREIIFKTQDRHSTLVFCSGVQHAYDVAERLEKLSGRRTEAVTGETVPLMRAAALRDFKDGTLPYLVNCDVLTTGFDAPNIDTIAILRATKSPGLFAQICGRGFRPHESKTNCLVLDYGENIQRHGPLDAKSYGQYIFRGGGPGGLVSKECPACHEVIPAGTQLCLCGYEFPKKEIDHTGYADVVGSLLSEEKEWDVVERSWHEHRKRGFKEGDLLTVRMDYTCVPHEGEGTVKEGDTFNAIANCRCGNGTLDVIRDRESGKLEAVCSNCRNHSHYTSKYGNLSEKRFSEWICPEHSGFAREKFETWWQKMTRAALPSTVEECLQIMDLGVLAEVTSITVTKDGRWDRIVHHQIGMRPTPDEWHTEVELDPWENQIPF